MAVTRSDQRWCNPPSISPSSTIATVFICYSADSILRSSEILILALSESRPVDEALWLHSWEIFTHGAIHTTQLSGINRLVSSQTHQLLLHQSSPLAGWQNLGSGWPLISGSLWFRQFSKVDPRFGALCDHDQQSDIISWTNASVLTRATNSCHNSMISFNLTFFHE